MSTKILCSTGTMVGRANGYDHHVILQYQNAIEADGFELMMLSPWYGSLPKVAADLEKYGVMTPLIHFEKDLGYLLVQGGEETARGRRFFRDNVEMAHAIGAEKAVFHLWDGRFTEQNVEDAIALLEELYALCDRFGVALLVEGVPCRVRSPLAAIRTIAEKYPAAGFTFDTRHSTFMKETEAFLADPVFETQVRHIHVSDYTGQMLPHAWGVTRPIVQPGEGIIDFDALFRAMPPYHGGTVTLESPAMTEDGTVQPEKLNRSLCYLAGIFQNR